jgi:hypothetical protein
MLPALTELSVRVHGLLLQGQNLAVARRLALACLADPEQGRVDDLGFPEHPDCHIYSSGRGSLTARTSRPGPLDRPFEDGFNLVSHLCHSDALEP